MKKIKISDFADVITGGTPSTSNREYWDNGDIPWLQSGACQDCIITECDTFITQKGLDESAAKMMKPDSVLIALTGATTGKVGYLTFPACANQSVTGIQPNERFIPKYLYYYLKGIRQKILDDSYGGAQKHISQGYVKNLEIPLETITKQQQIADVFERIDALISFRKHELKMLDDLIKARFVEMFGDFAKDEYKYKTRKLGDVARVSSSHRVFTTEFVDEGIPFYRGTEIGELANGIKPSEPYYISKEHYEMLASDETKPKLGDLLMPSICNKGQVWMVDTEEPFYYKDGRVLCISADRSIYDTRYLQYFMRAKTEVEYPKMGSGSTFAEFKIFIVKDFDVLTPPIDVQKSFSAFAQQVDKSKVVVQQALDKAQLLFDSLMQKYFG